MESVLAIADLAYIYAYAQSRSAAHCRPALMTDGWTKNSVVAGDVITVDANPARNGTKFGRMLRVAKADGTVLTWGERNRVSQ